MPGQAGPLNQLGLGLNMLSLIIIIITVVVVMSVNGEVIAKSSTYQYMFWRIIHTKYMFWRIIHPWILMSCDLSL